jgi:hypothetical protein
VATQRLASFQPYLSTPEVWSGSNLELSPRRAHTIFQNSQKTSWPHVKFAPPDPQEKSSDGIGTNKWCACWTDPVTCLYQWRKLPTISFIQRTSINAVRYSECVHVCAHVCACVHMCAFVCVCVHLCAFVCICVRLCAFDSRMDGL